MNDQGPCTAAMVLSMWLQDISLLNSSSKTSVSFSIGSTLKYKTLHEKSILPTCSKNIILHICSKNIILQNSSKNIILHIWSKLSYFIFLAKISFFILVMNRFQFFKIFKLIFGKIDLICIFAKKSSKAQISQKNFKSINIQLNGLKLQFKFHFILA